MVMATKVLAVEPVVGWIGGALHVLLVLAVIVLLCALLNRNV